IAAVGHLLLPTYRELNQSAIVVQHFVQQKMREWFHQIDFQKWREEHFKEFLKLKRKEEREKKRYTRPYTEYLEQIEKQMFREFWDAHRYLLTCALIIPNTDLAGDLKPYAEQLKELRADHAAIQKHLSKLEVALQPLSADLQILFLQTMRSFEELSAPLQGRYRQLRNTKKRQLEKHLAAAFYPLSGYGYGRSQAFRQSTPQGSVFKLVVAYQGLLERFDELKASHQSFMDANPLTLIDSIKWHSRAGSNDQILGYHLDGTVIKRYYKGGRLPRCHPNIGKIDVMGAIEQSSNIYFSILAAEHLSDPLNLISASRNFGFGEKSGIELPGEFAGSLPTDIAHDRTGLYSFAIGQHSLIVTPLQSAVMISAIANRGRVLRPKVVHAIAGQESLSEYRDPFSRALYPFQDNLSLVGIHFPLFTGTGSEDNAPSVWFNTPEIKRTIEMEDPVRKPLVEGMHRVLTGLKGTARPQVIRALYRNPDWKRNFLDLKSQLVGKTGTAEILYKQSIDAQTEAIIQNHIWYSGAVFSEKDEQRWEDPELTVVVYLRFSEAGGKESAPLASQIVKKWREIKKKRGD
ncbi:MAG: penicillin-binding transpeptidase domain-containing protein, partial [Chlamydiota bacterium]